MIKNQTALFVTVIAAIFMCLLVGTLYISNQVDHLAVVVIFAVCSLLLLSDSLYKMKLRKKNKASGL